MGAVQSVCCAGSSGDGLTEASACASDSLVTASNGGGRYGDVDSLAKDFDYMIHIDKTSGAVLGIDCGSTDGKTLQIDGMNDGLIAAWNMNNPDTQVKVLDRIVEVNGIRDSDMALLEEMRQQKPLQVKLKRAVTSYIVLEQKYARATADKASDLVGDEVPMGTIIVELDRQEIPSPDVERVQFEMNGEVGWLSVTEADGSEVLRLAEVKPDGSREYEVLEQKYARADADKQSDLVGGEVPAGSYVTAIQSVMIPSPVIVRIMFEHNGILGWLSVVEADGSEVLGNMTDHTVQQGLIG